jgi:hypothetical protein
MRIYLIMLLVLTLANSCAIIYLARELNELRSSGPPIKVIVNNGPFPKILGEPSKPAVPAPQPESRSLVVGQ